MNGRGLSRSDFLGTALRRTGTRAQPRNAGDTQLTRGRREDAVCRRINHWLAEPIKAETAWDQACRRHYPAMLKRTTAYHAGAVQRLTLPSGKRLAGIIT